MRGTITVSKDTLQDIVTEAMVQLWDTGDINEDDITEVMNHIWEDWREEQEEFS